MTNVNMFILNEVETRELLVGGFAVRVDEFVWIS
jgi:hypothetical protein